MYLDWEKTRNKYRLIDIETDDLNATTIHCAVVIDLTDNSIHRLVGRLAVCQYIESQPKDTIWAGHNALSFDIPTINRLLGLSIPIGRILDTLVLSYLYYPRLPGGHSLESYGERLGIKKEGIGIDFRNYSPELLERCVSDARINLRLLEVLTRKMKNVGFSEKSCEIEHRIRHIINKQERNGFYFDTGAARTLYSSLRSRQENLETSIRTIFPAELVRTGTYKYRITRDGRPYAGYLRHLEEHDKVILNEQEGYYDVFDYEDFNIASPQQRLRRLISLGWEPKKFTKKGSPQVDEDSLKDFAKILEGDTSEKVSAIAEYLVVFGRANMVETWLNHVGPDSRIHGRVFSCGAGSRRMTHNSPNTANIPSNEAEYGEDCRSLWTVPGDSDRVLLGYDAKSIQMRCFSNVLPDPTAGRRYYDTDFCADPHQENADIIGIARKPVKNVFYANLFGAWPPKLATTAGMVGTKAELEEYGSWIREQMYAVCPGLKEATEAAQAEFRQNGGFLLCPDGGFVRCPEQSAALNYKIQPAEAIVMKVASIFIDQRARKAGIDHMKVGDIHDESQHEVNQKDAEELGKISCEAIKDSGEELNFRVPLAGDYKIGKSWAETH